MTWFDLSPMRPSEYWDTEANTWLEALNLQDAYNRGLHRARTEQKAILAMEAEDNE